VNQAVGNSHAMVICHIVALRPSSAAKRGRTANNLSQHGPALASSRRMMPIRLRDE